MDDLFSMSVLIDLAKLYAFLLRVMLWLRLVVAVGQWNSGTLRSGSQLPALLSHVLRELALIRQAAANLSFQLLGALMENS
jgi:hypothetical protein